MFFFIITAMSLTASGVSWNHDGSLIKFNQYEHTHHFELYDAWHDNNKIIYRAKTIEMKIQNYSENNYEQF
jgi:hypothetical protein